jgi:hypothetical protein
MGKPMGRHPILVTYSHIPKRGPKGGRDPMIFASSYALPSTGRQSTKIGHYDQESPKTWSRANTTPKIHCTDSILNTSLCSIT